MSPLSRCTLPWLAVILSACGGRRILVEQRTPRLVEIEVEVYDPESNGVWEGVSVRVVEGYHEWSRCTCPAGNPNLWQVTARDGRVLFTAADLADADIGFREDGSGDAILSGDRDEDEAFVLVEIDAIGFDRVFVDVPLTWREPSVLVSVPFGATTAAASVGGPQLRGERQSGGATQRLSVPALPSNSRTAFSRS
jgi:hypothetical protein